MILGKNVPIEVRNSDQEVLSDNFEGMLHEMTSWEEVMDLKGFAILDKNVGFKSTDILSVNEKEDHEQKVSL